MKQCRYIQRVGQRSWHPATFKRLGQLLWVWHDSKVAKKWCEVGSFKLNRVLDPSKIVWHCLYKNMWNWWRSCNAKFRIFTINIRREDNIRALWCAGYSNTWADTDLEFCMIQVWHLVSVTYRSVLGKWITSLPAGLRSQVCRLKLQFWPLIWPLPDLFKQRCSEDVFLRAFKFPFPFS